MNLLFLSLQVMGKILLFIFVLFSLTGCFHQTESAAMTEAEKRQKRLDEAQARVEHAKSIVNACNKNDGPIDIKDIYEGSRSPIHVGTIVFCKDGMQRYIPD
jgi:hypothetical protein